MSGQSRARASSTRPPAPRSVQPAPATQAPDIPLQRLASAPTASREALLSLQGAAGNRAVQRLIDNTTEMEEEVATESPELFNVPDAHLPAPGGGQAIPDQLRRGMEGALGQDFSDVRVHTDSSPDSVGALAYTQGSDVHFRPGMYQPDSQSGREAIGHELAHVVQQRAGRVATPQGMGAPVNADPSLEAEADAVGREAARAIDNGVALAEPGAAPASIVDAPAQRLAAPVQRIVSEEELLAAAAAAPAVADPTPAAPGAAAAAGGGAAAAAPEAPAAAAEEPGAQALVEALGSDVAEAGAVAAELAAVAGPDTAEAAIAEGDESAAIPEDGPALPGSAAEMAQAAGVSAGPAAEEPAAVPPGLDRGLLAPEAVAPPPDLSNNFSQSATFQPGPGPVAPAALVPQPPAGPPPVRMPTAQAPAAPEDQPYMASSDIDDAADMFGGMNDAYGGVAYNALDIAQHSSEWTGAAAEGTKAASNFQAAGLMMGGLGAGAGTVAGLAQFGAGASAAVSDPTGKADTAVDSLTAVGGLTGAAGGLASFSQSILTAGSMAGSAASAGMAAGGLGIATGAIDTIRGGVGAGMAAYRANQLNTLASTTQDAGVRSAATEVAGSQKDKVADNGITGLKGALTVAGSAVLIAAGLTNPVGWAILAAAALIGGAWALKKWWSNRKKSPDEKKREEEQKTALAIELHKQAILDGVDDYKTILVNMGFKRAKVDQKKVTAKDIRKRL